MSDMRDDNGLSPDEWLAAEYALGVLERDDRARAEVRMARDAAFGRLVEDWQSRLVPMAADLTEVAPPAALWDRIAASLPAADEAPSRAGLWQSLAFWRGLTAASAALAVACLGLFIYVGGFPSGSRTPAPLLASIDGGGHRHFIATVDPAHGNVAVVPAAFAADATRVPELWLIPADGRPRPLGILSATQAVTIAIPAALIPHATADAVLAVSLEPQGGSPTGQPTGPVVASGKLTRL
ncbi:anti-sigma factor [Undibacter mobilis]|uniref:Anti-sigma factor n=1 Tax=Undibacter mobilis TaxID=2292256 RepID=A0A371B6I1_9BRAD|nr:anti-sigma factor [Undibacter mobilis]RDV03199.1 anti-sigma factor [Undibacter mobilis]